MKRILIQNIKKVEIVNLRKEIKKRDNEIIEKDSMILNLENKDESSCESSEDEDNYNVDDIKKIIQKNQKPSMHIGKGHFGKEFEVNEVMEDEAAALRKQWRK